MKPPENINPLKTSRKENKKQSHPPPPPPPPGTKSQIPLKNLPPHHRKKSI